MLMSFLLTGFGIWAIVEFILYLVKDNPFNFTSLWLTISAFVLDVFFLFNAFESYYYEQENDL
jgi:hypothetical protein